MRGIGLALGVALLGLFGGEDLIMQTLWLLAQIVLRNIKGFKI